LLPKPRIVKPLLLPRTTELSYGYLHVCML
jgi:hypothetical protein